MLEDSNVLLLPPKLYLKKCKWSSIISRPQEKPLELLKVKVKDEKFSRNFHLHHAQYCAGW